MDAAGLLETRYISAMLLCGVIMPVSYHHSHLSSDQGRGHNIQFQQHNGVVINIRADVLT